MTEYITGFLCTLFIRLNAVIRIFTFSNAAIIQGQRLLGNHFFKSLATVIVHCLLILCALKVPMCLPLYSDRIVNVSMVRRLLYWGAGAFIVNSVRICGR